MWGIRTLIDLKRTSNDEKANVDREWEKHYRPYRIRSFTPDSYLGLPPADDHIDWSQLGQGRALLMIHGTGSQAHTGFAGLPRTYLEDLHRAYGGRVFAPRRERRHDGFIGGQR